MKLSAALMCHAPIVIPEIAGERAGDCQKSTEAMKQAADFLIRSEPPDSLLVLSPHTPRLPDAFGVVGGNPLYGNFSQFGHPEIHAGFDAHPDARAALATLWTESPGSLKLGELPEIELDHGAMVPLHFIAQAGWQGPTMIMGFPYSASHSQCRELGSLLRKMMQKTGGNWAICASGDMSHRLQPGAPAGFDPQAGQFDKVICEHILKGNYQGALDVEPALRELAAEDVVDSLEIAASIADFSSDGHHYYSYEAPFGVGYLISALYRIDAS